MEDLFNNGEIKRFKILDDDTWGEIDDSEDFDFEEYEADDFDEDFEGFEGCEEEGELLEEVDFGDIEDLLGEEDKEILGEILDS